MQLDQRVLFSVHLLLLFISDANHLWRSRLPHLVAFFSLLLLQSDSDAEFECSYLQRASIHTCTETTLEGTLEGTGRNTTGSAGHTLLLSTLALLVLLSCSRSGRGPPVNQQPLFQLFQQTQARLVASLVNVLPNSKKGFQHCFFSRSQSVLCSISLVPQPDIIKRSEDIARPAQLFCFDSLRLLYLLSVLSCLLLRSGCLRTQPIQLRLVLYPRCALILDRHPLVSCDRLHSRHSR
mmetsp:Transcript_19160/g.49109  ORF Transcript_19160/g.49109 Transcript_19160/m.49109 type:complete len:237 (-) Transcript_19160:2883-3593(-)